MHFDNNRRLYFNTGFFITQCTVACDCGLLSLGRFTQDRTGMRRFLFLYGDTCARVHFSAITAIGVGVQSRHFCPKIIYEKLTKCPHFTWYLPEKITINRIPEFYMTFARKMPEFYMIISRKILFPIFFLGGGHVAPSLPSPTHDNWSGLGIFLESRSCDNSQEKLEHCNAALSRVSAGIFF